MCLAADVVLADSETMWGHTVDCTRENAAAHLGLGNTLSKRGQYDEAALHLEQAVELNPSFAKGHYDLGLVLTQQGRADAAMTEYQKAVQIDPDMVAAQCNFGNALSHGAASTKPCPTTGRRSTSIRTWSRPTSTWPPP